MRCTLGIQARLLIRDAHGILRALIFPFAAPGRLTANRARPVRSILLGVVGEPLAPYRRLMEEPDRYVR